MVREKREREASERDRGTFDMLVRRIRRNGKAAGAIYKRCLPIQLTSSKGGGDDVALV